MAVYRGRVSRAGKSKEADVSVGLGTGSVDGTAAVSFEGCSESTDLLKNNLGRGSPRIKGLELSRHCTWCLSPLTRASRYELPDSLLTGAPPSLVARVKSV